eukprot:8997943-Lingulodinium_polyedra.AAC.1
MNLSVIIQSINHYAITHYTINQSINQSLYNLLSLQSPEGRRVACDRADKAPQCGPDASAGASRLGPDL